MPLLPEALKLTLSSHNSRLLVHFTNHPLKTVIVLYKTEELGALNHMANYISLLAEGSIEVHLTDA